MSMWRIGREAVRIGEPVLTPLDRSVAYTRAASDGTGGPLGDIADTVAKWIPGEVLALYVAGVTMIGTPNLFWLIVGVLLAPLVVVLGAYANSGKLPTDQRIYVRAGLGLVAMLLWSLVVPGSGWWEWGAVADNPEAVALTGGALGLIFGLIAEGTARWVDARESRPRTPGTTWAPAFRSRTQSAAQAAPAQAEAPHSEALQADAPHSEAPHSEAPQADAPQAEAAHSEAAHSEAAHSEAAHSEAAHSEAAHSEAAQPDEPSGPAGIQSGEQPMRETTEPVVLPEDEPAADPVTVPAEQTAADTAEGGTAKSAPKPRSGR
jgi:hypothetical protein